MFRNIPVPPAIGFGALLIVSLFSLRLLLRSRRKRKITRIIETLFGRKLSKPPAVGLDIGTSFCRVAVYQDGKVQVVSDQQGRRAIPSCVSFGVKDCVTGEQAISWLTHNAINTVYDAKLMMGRRFEDPVVKNGCKYWSYKVISDEGKAKIEVEFKGRCTVFSPEEITTLLLKKLKEMAEYQVGDRLEDAVITVPAFFTDSQRQATIEAGVNAGFRVMRLINEPAAAAVAFGFAKRLGKSEVNILVMHIGAGTSDASLVLIHEGTFTVKATAGDANLGGKDFDERLMMYFQKEFKQKFHKDLDGNNNALLRLRHACEKAKITLGATSIANIELDSLLPDLDFYATITKNDFEDICSDLFDKLIGPVAKVLKDAKLPKSQVDHVVLVGACTHVPKFQQVLNVFFEGREPDRVLDPEDAAVIGAALQAAVLAGHNVDKLPDLALLDVNPLSLGIETVGGIMTILIPRNSVLPARETQIFTTYLDNQSSVLVQVYEGERGVTKDNNFLGKFKLSGIPPMPRGVPQVCVTFTIDVNGILTVTACEKNTGKENKITITRNQNQLNKDLILRKVQEAAKYKEEDDQVCQRVSAKISYENYVFKVKSTMEDLESSVKDRVSEEDRNSVLNKCYEAMQWLTSNPTANKEELLARLAEMEIACSPVIAKLYALKGVICPGSTSTMHASSGNHRSTILESLD
uniref:Uncharacterized protein n=1 Tax=Strigamia maritima TaxID=126957 RepID=T1IWZ9_STRMM